MATRKALSPFRHYQIAPPIITSKFLSKSAESFSNQTPEKQVKKSRKMKKSQTILESTSLLRRRFSLFRLKRSQQSNDHSNVQTLQQIIEQLRQDLKIKTDELIVMREQIENKRNGGVQPSTDSIEQTVQMQSILNTKLEDMLRENDQLKKSIQELESYAYEQQIILLLMRLFRRFRKPTPPVSPPPPLQTVVVNKAPNSLLTNAFSEPTSTIIKSTNFTGSIPTSRAEIRHKSEIEIEVKHEKPPQLRSNLSPVSISPYPPVARPTGITNKQTPTKFHDENFFSPQYQTPKRRCLTNSIQTQTPPASVNSQQFQALTEETLAKTNRIQILRRDLTDCQTIIKQQDHQLATGKKDREQLCLIIDERTIELRNLKQKNEQLEQMIRNEQEHSNDRKKLLSLLHESQEERDQLVSEKRQTDEHLKHLEERIRHYENESSKMRDQVLCSKIQSDHKVEENQSLSNELTEMKTLADRLEQENQKLKLQIDHERKKMDDCTKSKTLVDMELQTSLEKLRTQRCEYETKLSTLDETLKCSQKQYQSLQQSQRLLGSKHQKELDNSQEHIQQLEMKIQEVIRDRTLVSMRCDELIEENRKLEKALADKEDDYEEKINAYREKNSLLVTQLEEMERKFNDTKKQLEVITLEKDETLADMLVAVRVASELRYDAEDRLNKANDDLKRVTEHIEQERTIDREVQRRQTQLPASNRNSSVFCDFGHVRIKEMIQTLEANSRNSTNSLNTPIESTVRQRPLSQPCTRSETNALLITNYQPQQFGTTTDDAKILSSTKNTTPSLNNSHRSDLSLRSITNEQYDEMKSIVEGVFTRMPGSVCKRDALLKWCAEKLANYGLSITNFSNSWTDGIAFCSLLHSYLPDRFDLEMIKNESKKKRFEIAFNIAHSVGIVPILDVDEMCSSEWPDWERVMYYVALIFRHFETSSSVSADESISPIFPIPQATSSPLSPTPSSPLCASIRSPNSISTTLYSPLQTV